MLRKRGIAPLLTTCSHCSVFPNDKKARMHAASYWRWGYSICLRDPIKLGRSPASSIYWIKLFWKNNLLLMLMNPWCFWKMLPFLTRSTISLKSTFGSKLSLNGGWNTWVAMMIGGHLSPSTFPGWGRIDTEKKPFLPVVDSRKCFYE